MTTTKHLRLFIDFSISIAEAPPVDNSQNPPDPVYYNQQARLLAAVKNNPQVLTHWLRSLVASKMCEHNSYEWDAILLGDEVTPRKILEPVIEALPGEDQEFFEEVDQAGYFSDFIDLFYESFTILEGPVMIIEQ